MIGAHATARMGDDLVQCDWCHVQLSARGLAAHKNGLACQARGMRLHLVGNGWTPVGTLSDTALEALQKAGVAVTYDYAGTFHAGGPGRKAHAPRTHYVKDTWAHDLWMALASLGRTSRIATFVFLARDDQARAVVQGALLLGATLDAAFWRQLRGQFPTLQAAIDTARAKNKEKRIE